MANDQLNLFGNLNDESEASDQASKAPSAVGTGSSSAASEPTEKAVAQTKKSRAKKASTKTSPQKASEKTESGALQDLYSKKDWSPLVDAGSKNVKAAPSASKPVGAAVANRTESFKVQVVQVPIVRSAKDLPPTELDDALNAEIEKDVVDEEPPSKEPRVMSVSDLNKHIREILEGRFPLLWLKAEISNFKAHTSGHFYFSLKDAKAQINAVMFRGYNSSLRFRPEDGMEVLVRGKITVYEPRGNYQIFCEMMEPVGAGALQKAFEQLKAKLQKEGLFDQERKRPLPAHPRHIAIVTSPTGAAIRDMLNVLGRRFKGVHITVVPCKVQGDAAPGEIVEAIHLTQKLRDVDVMIVGRGGGSIEDLWAFNDERVARAIAAARVPVISAVGHEVDFTIADFVADLRAPTPSAAAELVVQNSADLVARIATLTRSLRLALLQRLEGAKEQLTFISRRLVDPQRMLQDASFRCDELMQRLEMSMRHWLDTRASTVMLLRTRLGSPIVRISSEREIQKSMALRLRTGMQFLLTAKQQALTKNMAVLDSLSPLKVLDRGFSMVVVNEKIVTHAKDLVVGDTMTIRMCQGSVEAEVKKVNKDER